MDFHKSVYEHYASVRYNYVKNLIYYKINTKVTDLRDCRYIYVNFVS